MRGDIIVSEGVAECHPKDNFCKNTGRKLSLARALKYFDKGFPSPSKASARKVRKLFWDAYAAKRGGLD